MSFDVQSGKFGNDINGACCQAYCWKVALFSKSAYLEFVLLDAVHTYQNFANVMSHFSLLYHCLSDSMIMSQAG
jgi:hypothetical protein